MYCRGHQLRVQICQDYDICLVARLHLLPGQTKQSSCGCELTGEYYVFNAIQKGNGPVPDDPVIQVSGPIARDFMEMCHIDNIPCFNPVYVHREAPSNSAKKNPDEEPKHREPIERSDLYCVLKGGMLRGSGDEDAAWRDVVPGKEAIKKSKSADDIQAKMTDAASEVNRRLQQPEYRGSSGSSSAKSKHKIVRWNEAAKQLYNAILLLICAWDITNYDSILFDLLTEAKDYCYCNPYLHRVKAVNSIIAKDRKKRTLTQIVTDELASLDYIRGYQFNLLETILQEGGVESHF